MNIVERERQSRTRGLYRFTRFSSLAIYANGRIFIVTVNFLLESKNNERNHSKNIYRATAMHENRGAIVIQNKYCEFRYSRFIY